VYAFGEAICIKSFPSLRELEIPFTVGLLAFSERFNPKPLFLDENSFEELTSTPVTRFETPAFYPLRC
jgi:hypothetical protein